MVNSLGMVNAVAGSPSYTGRALRQLSSVRYAGATAARPLGARSGVRPGTPASTVSATATTWTAQPFAGLIDGQAAVEAGPYEFAFDDVISGPVSPASGAFARIDIIWVRVDDPAESDGSSVPLVVCGYTAGTVASTPPATPARTFVVARINVPISGGGSPTVSWVAPYCASAGGKGRVNTSSQLPLVGAPGDEFTALDTGATYRWIAGAWKAAMRIVLPTAGSVFAGAVWDGVSPTYMQAGRVSGVASGGSGLIGIFPEPFPNGLISITANIYNAGGVTGAHLRDAGSNLTGPNFQILLPGGGGVAGTPQSYSYTAVGW